MRAMTSAAALARMGVLLRITWLRFQELILLVLRCLALLLLAFALIALWMLTGLMTLGYGLGFSDYAWRVGLANAGNSNATVAVSNSTALTVARDKPASADSPTRRLAVAAGGAHPRDRALERQAVEQAGAIMPTAIAALPTGSRARAPGTLR